MDTAPGGLKADALFPRSRQAILGILFSYSDRAFYLRELAGRTNVGLSQLQRELKRLVASGIVRRFEEGRHVYFQANKASSIYVELRGLVTKTFGAVPVLRNALEPFSDRVALAFIYGSLARGEESFDSDVDLMVLGTASFRELTGGVKDAEAQLAREVNVTVYPVEEFQAKLSERHHFLTSVVDGAKIFVVGDERELGALLSQ